MAVIRNKSLSKYLQHSGIAVTQKYQVQIYITLRPSVLDPAGTAVQSGLRQLGYDHVDQVRIGKYIELVINAADEDQVREQLDRMCDQFLANPVIENYRFDWTGITPPLESEVGT